MYHRAPLAVDCRGRVPLNKVGKLIQALGQCVVFVKYPPAGRGGGRGIGARSVLLGLLWFVVSGSAWLWLSLPLWSVVVARGEEEGASSSVALEVVVSRALLGQVPSQQLGCCFTGPSSLPASSRSRLLRGFRWQASFLHWRRWSGALYILCLASVGI
jgi:hypothetical protein